jgi:thiol:disulfide interchange protein DsbC
VPDAIKLTPIASLYEARFGSRVLYISADGQYVMRGDLIDIKQRKNLSEDARREGRVRALQNIDDASLIRFAASDTKRVVVVFTDVECPYCVRLHQEVPYLNANGVEIRYAAFPRKGIPSGNYDQMVSVWCNEDRPTAMTDAKFGRDVADATCENPVARHYEIGLELGVKGTPTMFLDNGEVVRGYVPAARLLQMLERS